MPVGERYRWFRPVPRTAGWCWCSILLCSTTPSVDPGPESSGRAIRSAGRRVRDGSVGPVACRSMSASEETGPERAATTELFDKIVNLSKRRGFVFPSAEIYGGFRSTYDYGPIGVLLLRNVKDAWWRSMVQMRHDVVGLDAAILCRRRSWRPPVTSPTSPTRSWTAPSATAVPPRQARRPRCLPHLRDGGASPSPGTST